MCVVFDEEQSYYYFFNIVIVVVVVVVVVINLFVPLLQNLFTTHSLARTGKLTERQVHYLVAGANGVRKLVRIKIADDNDLDQV